jgi:hypothetical protein
MKPNRPGSAENKGPSQSLRWKLTIRQIGSEHYLPAIQKSTESMTFLVPGLLKSNSA